MSTIVEIMIRPWSRCDYCPFPPERPVSVNGDRIVEMRWVNDSDEIAIVRLFRNEKGIIEDSSRPPVRMGYKFINKDGRLCVLGDLSVWENMMELRGYCSPELLR